MATINGTTGNDTLNGGADPDDIHGDVGDDTLYGAGGEDTLYGDGGNDTLYGQAGSDTYYGGEGNDRIGDAGGDFIYGGGGDDIVDTHVSAGSSYIDLGIGNDQALIGLYGSPVFSYHATIIGGEGNDLAVVQHGSGHLIDLGVGDDSFVLGGGSSIVTLGTGADEVMLGYDSVSTLFFPMRGSMVTLTDYQPGVDKVSAAWMGGWLINWDGRTNPFATGHLSLVQMGDDAVLMRDFDGAGSDYSPNGWVTFKGLTIGQLGANDLGGFAPDGSPAAGGVVTANRVIDGVPIFEGGAGADQMTGTEGRDYFSGRAGDDVVYASGGNDIVYASGGNDIVYGGNGDDFLQSEGGNATLYGEAGNDTMRGSLYFPGHLVLDGGEGDDAFSVFPDTYFGPVENYGQGSPPGTSFEIIGGAGNDTAGFNEYAPRGAIVDLGSGNDMMGLTGWQEVALTLGTGTDTIRLDSYRHAGATAALAATVADFQAGVDLIVLPQATNFNQYFTGWNGTSNPFAGGYVRLFQDGNDTLIQFDKDGGSNNWGTVLRLTGINATALTAADFSGWAPVVFTADDNFVGTVGPDNFSGGEGRDSFDFTQGGDDIADGGVDDDSFFFGAAFTAADRVDGGAGTNDQLVLQGDYTGLNALTLGATTITGVEVISLLAGAGNSYAITTVDANVAAGHVLSIIGTALAASNSFTFNGAAETDGRFQLYGGAGTDSLTGGGGDDVLAGGLGGDVLAGGAGTDTASYAADVGAVFVNLFSGAGASNAAQGDTYSSIENVIGTSYGDFIIGDGGANRLDGGAGDDVLIGAMGADVLVGGTGSDTASYEENYGAVFVNLSTGAGASNAAQGDTYDGIENVRGSIYNDYLIGDAGANRLEGNAGDDVLIGALGADALVGGAGIDTASYEENYGPVFVNLRSGQGSGNAAHGDTYDGIENVVGTLYGDVIVGNEGVNRLDGGGGEDVLIGGLGGDALVGGAGTDTVSYEDNYGAVFVNLSTGAGSSNAAQGDSYTSIENVVGSMFDDYLIGDTGANRLSGGYGNDWLMGAAGADTFVFEAPLWAGGNLDTIADFTVGEDKIELSSAMFGVGAGALPSALFVSGAPTQASHYFVYDPATGVLYFDPDGSGAQAGIAMLQLTAGLALTAGDFVIA